MMTAEIIAGIALTAVLFSSIPNARAAGPVKMTVLFDNTVAGNEGTAGWGFACLIEGLEKTILFDTGADREIFLKNAALLKKDLTKVEIAVISHNHGDHTAGLFAVLEKKRDLPVLLPDLTPNEILDSVRTAGGRPEITTTVREICRDVFLVPLTGKGVSEVALALRTQKGLVLLTGCAHPGIVEFLALTNKELGVNTAVVLGGFHLMNHTEEQVGKIISSFKENGVTSCGATHCTGEKSIALFAKTFGANFLSMGVGRVLAF
jgi:7,8-dihydropterin-6-yl-methyl-4-(beta-D-ribofuranosyl)aminobenzene 5'-phosphate synthase